MLVRALGRLVVSSSLVYSCVAIALPEKRPLMNRSIDPAPPVPSDAVPTTPQEQGDKVRVKGIEITHQEAFRRVRDWAVEVVATLRNAFRNGDG